MANLLGRPFETKPKHQVDRKSKLRQFFSIKPESRSEGQTYEIVQLLKENSFLQRYAGTNQLNQLVKNMRIQIFEPQQLILRQGEPGKSFFIILSGRVGVYRSEDSDSKARELLTGSCFGELSLLSSEVNPSTIISLESTEIIILDKEIYDSIIKSVQSQQMHTTYLFLKGLPVMNKVPEKLLHYFSQTAYIRTFVPGAEIIQQEEFATGIYIISEGSVKIVRNVLFDSALGVYKKIVIDEISVGDLFCDFAFFNKSPLVYSVIATMPVITYYLDKEELMSLDSALIQQFRRASKPYPEDSVLKSMYLEKRRWNNYKSNIVKTISVERQLRW